MNDVTFCEQYDSRCFHRLRVISYYRRHELRLEHPPESAVVVAWPYRLLLEGTFGFYYFGTDITNALDAFRSPEPNFDLYREWMFAGDPRHNTGYVLSFDKFRDVLATYDVGDCPTVSAVTREDFERDPYRVRAEILHARKEFNRSDFDDHNLQDYSSEFKRACLAIRWCARACKE